jgi:hypothetical protein
MKNLVRAFVALASMIAMSVSASVHGGGNPRPSGSAAAVKMSTVAQSVHGGGNPRPSGGAAVAKM